MCVCVLGGGGRGPNFSLLLLGGTKFWGAVLVVFAARQLKEKCQEQNVDGILWHIAYINYGGRLSSKVRTHCTFS